MYKKLTCPLSCRIRTAVWLKKSNIFAFAEDLRETLGIKADVFEISEVNEGTPFYDNIMREGVKIA